LSRRGFADDAAPLIAIIVVIIGLVLGGWLFSDRAPAAAPVSHVQSDYRAACTLEGMELAGVELTPQVYAPLTRCLCAPIESSPGGDL